MNEKIFLVSHDDLIGVLLVVHKMLYFNAALLPLLGQLGVQHPAPPCVFLSLEIIFIELQKVMMLCSRLTPPFASTSKSPSKFNIASMVIQKQI